MMDINPGLILWTIVSFVILLVILNKVAWQPILKALDAREKGIKDDIESAKSARLEAEQLLSNYQQKLNEATAEAQKTINEARQIAEKSREELIVKAKEDGDNLIAKARKQIDMERQAAVNQIRAEIATLVVASAEKIISKTLNDEDHKRLVMESLKEN